MTDTNPNGSDQQPSGTIQEAQDSFYNLLGGDEAPEEGQADNQPEAEEEVEVSEEEPTGEYEEEDSQDSDEQPETKRFKVKVAGEELELSQEELINYAQQGADYTRKTQQLAEQRKALDAEAQSVIQARQLRDTYAERLQMIEQMLTAQDSNEDLDSLKENDPIGYAVRVAEMQQKEKQMQAVQAERQRIAQEQQAEYGQNMQRYIATQAQELTKFIPEYAHPEKGESLRSDIRKFAKSVGFSDQDLSNVVDHRQVLTLYKAMQYDKLQQSKPQVTKRVSEAPKTLQSGNGIKSTNSDTMKRNQQQLKQSGKVRDAAKIFESFL
jgi:DNA repair exonuclease SbcCD ATPase subunit